MKLNALWIILAFVPAMSAGSVTVTCSGGAASVPVFNPSSVSGAVGDYTLDCTGGIPVVPPDAIPVIDVDVLLNVPVLDLGGWVLANGGDMTSGTFENPQQIDFVGVPFDSPGSGSLVLQIENILVNPSAEPPGFQFTESAGIFSSVSF
jgi:hypothetical protein